MKIRMPIVTVCGHVDHGKTSILDSLRGTAVAEKEAGGITQKISFTILPKENIQERSGKVLEKFNIPLEVPGFLLIDTPGHAAFTNLRKRGGSLADLAILVVDMNEGIKPQTAEVLQILKANKTPFIIALNKIDNISGWQAAEDGLFYDNLNRQVKRIKDVFEERLMTFVGSLQSFGFEAEIYTKISDFTKNVAIIPCSARSGEGISEILGIMCALSQKFLKGRISVKEQAKGVVLEIKKEKSINFLESILYDGTLKVNDEIAIASFGKAIITKIRSIQEALPLGRGFKATDSANAATGLRLQVTAKEEIMPGMPFQVIEGNLEEIEHAFSREISQNIRVDEKGIMIKADSLGSLEALLFLLRHKQIPVLKAGIGNITKKDIYSATVSPEEDRIILAFNVDIAEDVKPEEAKGVKIISNPIIYKIIEDFEIWRIEKLKEMERTKMDELPNVAKITILPYVFRNSNPAIFGVKVDGGKLKQNMELVNASGEKIGRVKNIQEEKNSMSEAGMGKEVAISIPGVNFERQLQKGQSLYSNMSEIHFRKFKEHKEILGKDEVRVLQEIAELRRKKQATWGI